MRTQKLNTFDVINVLLMLILVASILYPFLYIASVSLSGDLAVYRGEVSFYPVDFTLKNYEKVFQDERIYIGYKNTIMNTAVGSIIALIATSAGAFALSQKKMVLRRFFTMAIIFTIMFGGGMIPMYLVAKELGILDSVWAIVLPGAVSAFNLIIFRTFFQQLPEELFEAARLDGLTDLGIFFRIAVPLSKAVFAAVGLFVGVGLWNEYFKVAIYIRDPDLFPLSAVLRELIIKDTLAKEMASEAGGGGFEVIQSMQYAVLMVATVPILFAYPFLQKYFVKGVLIGSVKQ